MTLQKKTMFKTLPLIIILSEILTSVMKSLSKLLLIKLVKINLNADLNEIRMIILKLSKLS